MAVLQNALWFVVAIGLLVAFHEFGHFWVARRLGVKVLRYSVGFGRPLLLRRGADGCEYVLAAIPLGGYVKMLDEREGAVAPADLPRAYNRQEPWKRFLIVAAGPFANLVLAVALFWLALVIGQDGLRTVLAEPPAASAAAKAGLREGEVVIAINGEPVNTWTQLRTRLLEQVIDRKTMELELQAAVDRPESRRTVQLPLDRVRVDPEFLFDDLGLTAFQPPLEAVLSGVESGGSADQAGFKAGDRLLSRDGEPIRDWQDWARWVRAHPGAVVQIGFERDGQARTQTVIIGQVQDGETKVGRFGALASVDPARWDSLRAIDRLPPLQALPEAVGQTWRMSMLTLKMFGRMFTGEVSVKNVSGPLQIAEAAGFSASIGAAYYFGFLALVSVSLAVINLLPVPLLDGGHLLFTAIEMVKGSPLSERVQLMGQKFGLTFLALLMGLAFYNDLSRLIG